MNKNQKEVFHWGPFIKSLALIAIPIALQNLLTTTGSMVDTMMLAPLGEKYVGAVGLCAQFSSLMFSCYWGFVGGGMLFYAQYFGAKDDEGIERSYGMTLVFMMSVGILFGLLALFAPEQIMRLYTNNVELQGIGKKYLSVVGLSYFMNVFSMVMSCLLRTTERVRIPLIASIGGVLTNMFLNWVLIFGRWGFPRMGIYGAALATVFAAFVNMTIILILAKATRYPYLFHFKGHFRWNRGSLKLYLIKCFPIICNELLVGIGNMVINVTLGRQPAYVISAVAVFRTLEGLIIGFFMGFTNAASVLVGTCVGAGELRTAYERAKRLVYMCSIILFAVCLCVLVVHKPLFTAMSLSGPSLKAGYTMVLIFSFVTLFRMGNWIQNDTYRASGDAVTGTVLEIIFMYVLLLPCVLLSAFYFKAPYWVVFLCCYIDEPIRYVIMQRHLYSGKWIRPVTPEGKAALPAFMASLKRNHADSGN